MILYMSLHLIQVTYQAVKLDNIIVTASLKGLMINKVYHQEGKLYKKD